MIIGIFNYKGGSGKTATAVSLAAVLSQSRRVLFLDYDRQVADRSNWPFDYSVVHGDAVKFSKAGGIVIADTPALWTSRSIEAAQVVRQYILPVVSSLRSLDGAESTQRLLSQVSRKARLMGVLLAAQAHDGVSAVVADSVRDQWRDAVFSTATRRTSKLTECMELGGTVLDLPARAGIRQDFEALGEEVLARLKRK